MKKSSLGTLFATTLIDLLGFGLVIPFLPAFARHYGASSTVAMLLGSAYSVMQFLLLPVWGRLSDRVGRRPVLLWSIAASSVGMLLLASAASVPMLFLARIFSGAATANFGVAQAYIADVTAPEDRSRGMGLLGVAFGLGFVLGPFLGGLLDSFGWIDRPGAVPALAAASLSATNFFQALRFLPESLPQERRGKSLRSASPFDFSRFREAAQIPTLKTSFLIHLIAILSFSGMEYAFAIFAADAFHMSVRQTGEVLAFVGLMAAIVQGGFIRPLTRAFGETPLLSIGLFLEGIAFIWLGISPRLGAFASPSLWCAQAVVAVGSGLATPSLSSYVSRRSPANRQGTILGAFQSVGALGRVFGPAAAGVIYGRLGHGVTYYAAGLELLLAGAVSIILLRSARRHCTPAIETMS